MVFAYCTDDRSLFAFRTEAEATGYAEGVDVEDGLWRFFGDDGYPLDPVFSQANVRGAFTVRSGKYLLQASARTEHLEGILGDVVNFEGELRSRDSVERFLTTQSRQSMSSGVAKKPTQG